MTADPVQRLIDKLMNSPDLFEDFRSKMQAAGHTLLRNVENSPLPDPTSGEGKIRTGVIVDVETEGLDDAHQVIELAMLKFQYDAHGIVALGEQLMQLNDPGRPLTDEVRELTGWTDEDLKGKAFDLTKIQEFLLDVNVAVAYHASFDRSKTEKFLPDAGFHKMNWACAADQVDWKARGLFGSKRLEQIALNNGYVFEAHKGTSDIRATAFILNIDDPVRGRPFAEMVENARQPTLTVLGIQEEPNGRVSDVISFDQKEAAKDNGWKWDGEKRTTGYKAWHKTIPDTPDDREEIARFIKDTCGRHANLLAFKTTARTRYSNQRDMTQFHTRNAMPESEQELPNDTSDPEEDDAGYGQGALLRMMGR